VHEQNNKLGMWKLQNDMFFNKIYFECYDMQKYLSKENIKS